MGFSFYLDEKGDLKKIDDETNIIPDGELSGVKDQLGGSEYSCLYLRSLFPREYKVFSG